MHKIPVTVITGFLGAGKTTIIRHLLQNNRGRRIAVLVNEFGEVGIDGELLKSCRVCDEEEGQDSNIIELTNGCLCCTVQEEFYPTMQQLLARRDKIDAIVIETSGLALPKPLVQAFRWQEIRTRATVDGVVTVVDGFALANKGFPVSDLEALEAQRRADPSLNHATPLEELFEDQLACADLVLLSKADLLDEFSLQRLLNQLQQHLRPGVKIIPLREGKIDPEVLLGFNAAVEEDLANRPSHHDEEEEHEHDEQISSIVLEERETVAPQALLSRLRDLVAREEIYRIKGFVNVPHKPMRMVLQGVGNRFETFFDRLWQPGEERKTRLVVIGRKLNPLAVEAQCQLTVVPPQSA